MTIIDTALGRVESEDFAARLRIDELSERIARAIPLQDALDYRLIPIERTGQELVVAVAQPLQVEQIRHLERLSGSRIRQVRSTLNEIRSALADVWGLTSLAPSEEQLGRWLVLLGALSEKELEDGLAQQKVRNLPLGRTLVTLGLVDEDSLLEAIGLRHNLPTVAIDRYPLPAGIRAVVDPAFAIEHQLLPISCDGQVLSIATPDGMWREAFDLIEKQTGYLVRPVLCRADHLAAAIGRVYARPFERTVQRSIQQVLLDSGLIATSDLSFAAGISRRTGEDIDAVLIRLGRLDDLGVRRLSAARYGLDVLDEPAAPFERGRAYLPYQLAESRRAVILRFDDDTIDLAVADLTDTSLEEWLAYVSCRTVHTVLAEQADIERLQRQIYLTPSGKRRPSVSSSVGVEPVVAPLIRDGILTEGQLDQVIGYREDTGISFARALVESGQLSEQDLLTVQAVRLGLPKIRLDHFRFDFDLVNLIPRAVLLEQQVIPLHKVGSTLFIAAADPFNSAGLDLVEQMTGLSAQPVLSPGPEILAAVERVLPFDTAGDEILGPLGEMLIERRYLSGVQWRSVLQEVSAGKPLDLALASVTGKTAVNVAEELASTFGLEYLDVTPRQIEEEVIDALGSEVRRRRWVDPVNLYAATRLTAEQATAHAVLPVSVEGGVLVIACANPADQAGLNRISEAFETEIRWVVSHRAALESAIQRTLGRKNLGTYLLEEGLISQQDLGLALDYQRQTDTRLGDALLTLGIVRPEQLAEFLAVQHNLLSVDLTGVPVNSEIVRLVPEDLARERGLIPIDFDGQTITIAMLDPLDEGAIEEVRQATGFDVQRVLTTEGSISAVLQDVYRHDYLRHSAMDLVIRRPDESASKVLSVAQKRFFIGALIFCIAAAIWNPVAFFIVLNALATLFYFSFSGHRFYLIYKALGSSLEVPVSQEEIDALDDRDLPIYTILIPLYHEAEIVDRLVHGVDRLDYPKAKLDVKLLVEEDDPETLEAILAADLPAHFKIVIIPDSKPKGKPKACNYGLIQARGEYVVIFDAEDVPDPDQLKKVLIAFDKADPSVACIQCKLNYFNRRQNLLTRWFTTEYSMWFDLFLPGLGAAQAPIPLGGTSNHFRANVLKTIGAWDPWNVTEDADIGVRLFKAGYTTALVDSTTYEEANSRTGNWIRQRSRWVKGYVQTYLVHMRHPIQLFKELGPAGFFTFQMVIGGTFFGFLVNPIYWIMTLLWFVTHAAFIEQIFPAPIFYLGAISLYVGNFSFAYLNVAGCIRRRYYDMVKYAVISPLYWALMSIGAWKGFTQLFYKASYWEKTTHGLYTGPIDTKPAARMRDLL